MNKKLSLMKIQKEELMKVRGGRESHATASGKGTCGLTCTMTCYSSCEFLHFEAHSNATAAASNNAAVLACN